MMQHFGNGFAEGLGIIAAFILFACFVVVCAWTGYRILLKRIL